MGEYGGFEPTGREIREPTGTLVELSDGERTYTAIRYDEAWRGHSALTVGVDLIRSFLEYPMVTGLAEMTAGDTETAVFTYKTGPIWTVAELLRAYRDIGQSCGVRAAFELLYLGAQILDEAGDIGPREGCYSHGNLTPWRVALRSDGSVQIFGYGLPPVDWLHHRTDADFVVDADSVRYAPPERLDQEVEDPAADTYALVLIAWELITGEPLLNDHDIEELKRQISVAEPQQRLARAKVKGLTKAHIAMLSRALTFDPDTRLSGDELVNELRSTLEGKLAGPSLADVIERVLGKKRKTPKGRKIKSMEGTGMFTPAQLAAAAAEDEEEEAPKEEKRWSKRKAEPEEEEEPKRRRRRAEPDAKTDDGDDGAPRRRRRRTAEPEPAKAEEEAPRRRRRKAPEPEPETAGEEAPVRRRRRKAEPEPEVAEDKPAPRRRRRKAEPEPVEEAAIDTPVAKAKAPAEKATPRKRRKAPEPAAEATPEEAAEKPAPRRRRRRAEPEPSQEAAPAAAAEEEKPRRRRRRNADAEEPKADDEPKADEEPAAAPRRRRRRSE